MKIIINAEPEEMEYAMGLVVEAMATFARHPERIGWGWAFGKAGKRSFFVRRTKGGFSASPAGAGAVALVSTRTERDLPVTVSIEVLNVGSHRSRDEAAAYTAALEEALGAEAATRLAQDGAMPHRVADVTAAEHLVAQLTAIGDANAHAVHLSVWRS